MPTFAARARATRRRAATSAPSQQGLLIGGRRACAAARNCYDAAARRPLQAIVRRVDGAEHPHEAGKLMLDSTKAHARLGWRPRLSLDDTIRLAVAARPPKDVAALARPSAGHWVRAMSPAG